MHVSILTIGSQGDIRPYIALGVGLQNRGHRVTLVTSSSFAQFVQSHGLAHAPLQAEFLELMETAEGKKAIAGGNPMGIFKKVMPLMRQLFDESWEACKTADALIYNPKLLSAYHVAEKLGVPAILTHPVPFFSPTRDFPSPALPLPNLGGALNRKSHELLLKLLNAPYRKLINTWRKETLGLGPAGDLDRLNGRPIPKVYGFSTHVLPRPSDWDNTNYVSGYWFVDEQQRWQPPQQLQDFLNAGPAPIYVGFGSMSAEDAARKGAIVTEALAHTGQRGVLATGTGGLSLGEVPEHIHVLKEAPHDWLFPRMAAIIHHGGSGTTAAALRAGKPMLICPFFGDQPFWGRRSVALGVGAAPIPQKRLTKETLIRGLQTLLFDGSLAEQAAVISQAIQAEDGVGRAVDFIEAQL